MFGKTVLVPGDASKIVYENEWYQYLTGLQQFLVSQYFTDIMKQDILTLRTSTENGKSHDN